MNIHIYKYIMDDNLILLDIILYNLIEYLNKKDAINLILAISTDKIMYNYYKLILYKKYLFDIYNFKNDDYIAFNYMKKILFRNYNNRDVNILNKFKNLKELIIVGNEKQIKNIPNTIKKIIIYDYNQSLLLPKSLKNLSISGNNNQNIDNILYHNIKSFTLKSKNFNKDIYIKSNLETFYLFCPLFDSSIYINSDILKEFTLKSNIYNKSIDLSCCNLLDKVELDLPFFNNQSFYFPDNLKILFLNIPNYKHNIYLPNSLLELYLNIYIFDKNCLPYSLKYIDIKTVIYK